MKINKRKIILVVSSAIGALFIIYIGICFMASGKDFLSNASINGIDVSSLTKEEAIQKVENKYLKDINSGIIKLKVNDQEYDLNVANNLSLDAKKGVEDIYKKNQGFFLTRGFSYLFNHDYAVPVTINDEEVFKQQLLDSQVLAYSSVVPTTYKAKGDKVEFTKGKSGEIVKEKDVIDTIKNDFKNYNISKPLVIPSTDSKLDSSEMKTLHTSLSQGMKNATIDRENNNAIIPSKTGLEFNLEEATKKYDSISEGEKFTVSGKLEEPKVTTEMLETNLFKDVLGEYTTNVSGSSVRKNNVRLSGEKCNNVILLPGEEFSYNGSVGQRTKANGFGEAAAYSNGETVQEVGGGVCQTSSTLYNAVMLANLEVTDRSNHTYISSYVPIGRDATVSWGGPDFKFKNNSDYPIKIEMVYENSKLTSRIIGSNINGYRVEIKSERTATIPYSTKSENDPTLTVGTTKVKQSGSNGAKARSFRLVYDSNGTLISEKEEAKSSYSPHNKVVLVGTKPAPAQEPTHTPTPTPTPETPVTPEVPATPSEPAAQTT